MEYCNSSAILQVILIIKTIMDILRIGVTIILIVMIMLDIFKLVGTSEFNSKKAFEVSRKRIVVAIIVFLVPVIIDLAITNFGSAESYSMSSCYINATSSRIEELKRAEEIEIERSEEKLKISITIDNLSVPVNPSTTGSSALIKFLMLVEGSGKYCNNKNGYIAANIGDGTVTVGYGVTNHIQEVASNLGYGKHFPLTVGTCYPKEDIDAIFAGNIERIRKNISDKAKSLNITLKDNQLDALTSYIYQHGGSCLTAVLNAYKSKGNVGVKNYMYDHTGKNSKFTNGILHRRDAEYDMFANGVYRTKVYGVKCKFMAC